LVPFTAGGQKDGEERPNTELADNSLPVDRRTVLPKFITVAMHNGDMSDRKAYNTFMPSDMLSLPFVVGRAAYDAGLLASVSLARMTQIAMQSADTALAKYIELTEQEIRRSQRKESVKVE
jgi:hypothetical protein